MLHSYDANSNRTGYTAPDNSTNTYTYDTLNRLTTLANSWAGSFGFSYDALSRRTQMTRPTGLATNYTYDTLSHLLSVLHQMSGSTIDGAVYTLDADGNRTAKQDDLAGVTSNYTYDKIYELTQVTQGANTTESYSYDPVGNRLSSLSLSPYSNNTSNELTSTPSASYSYDSNGNTIGKTNSSGTTSYTWDFENRLTQVTLPGQGGTVQFEYDRFGRRIEKIAPTGTTVYTYDGDNIVETTNQSGGILWRFAQGQNIDEPLAVSNSTGVSYYEQDGLGSVTSLTTGSGQIAQTYTYDSFGNTTNVVGSLANPFRYTGREFDSETGLYYYRARYYDPSTGRFLNEDPIRFRGSRDFYAYVENDPVLRSDPSGLIHQAWNEPPYDGRLHDDPGGGLEVLCTKGRNIEQDIEWLEHSIFVRSAEIDELGNDADAGHIDRLDAEIATLDRCNGGCDEKPEPAPEPEPAPDSGPNWKAVGVGVGVVIVGVGVAVLCPECLVLAPAFAP